MLEATRLPARPPWAAARPGQPPPELLPGGLTHARRQPATPLTGPPAGRDSPRPAATGSAQRWSRWALRQPPPAPRPPWPGRGQDEPGTAWHPSWWLAGRAGKDLVGRRTEGKTGPGHWEHRIGGPAPSILSMLQRS